VDKMMMANNLRRLLLK